MHRVVIVGESAPATETSSVSRPPSEGRSARARQRLPASSASGAEISVAGDCARMAPVWADSVSGRGGYEVDCAYSRGRSGRAPPTSCAAGIFASPMPMKTSQMRPPTCTESEPVRTGSAMGMRAGSAPPRPHPTVHLKFSRPHLVLAVATELTYGGLPLFAAWVDKGVRSAEN